MLLYREMSTVTSDTYHALNVVVGLFTSNHSNARVSPWYKGNILKRKGRSVILQSGRYTLSYPRRWKGVSTILQSGRYTLLHSRVTVYIILV